MISKISIALFALFFSYVAESAVVLPKAEESDCESKYNVTPQDWADLRKDTLHPPEKMLCFLKCEYEEAGALNPDRTINVDKMIKKYTAWNPLSEPILTELRQCITNNEVPLNTCPDMKPYYDCVRIAEEEQESAAVSPKAEASDCTSKYNVTAQDWAELKKDTLHPPEKMLCFLKCEYEEAGALNPDKTINTDKLIKKITAWKPLSEPIVTELRQCISNNKVPLNTCPDMKPYYDCVRIAEEKQANEPVKA